jgi:hypothetical protein
MPFQKISSFFPAAKLPKIPIKYGDDIRWHFACFKDLMTENSTMTATSYMIGVQRGWAGEAGN